MLSGQLQTVQQYHRTQAHAKTSVTLGSCPSRRVRCRRLPVACCSVAASQPAHTMALSAPGALILEADGVVTDLHMDGHRVAFNRAFHDLGFDCTNWTPAVYHDLLAKGDGTGEGLVAAYYSTIGWPTFLPTNEQSMFAGKVYQLKQKQFRKMLEQGELPLRDGVLQVLKDAAAANTKIALISQTCSDPQDDVITCVINQIPPEVTSHITVYAAAMYSQQQQAAADEDADDADTAESNMSLLNPSAGLAAAAGRVKQRGAQEFVDRMTSALEGKSKAVPVQLDLSLQNPGASSSISASWIAAVAATLGVSSSSCVAAASSRDLVNAAAAAAMVTIAVPRKMAYAATYTSAAAKFEGWGPGYCTWQKLVALWRKQQQQ